MTGRTRSVGTELKRFPSTGPATHLLLAQVVHAPGHVGREMQQLLGGQRGRRAVGDGEGGVGLQHAALAEEVQQVPVGGVLDGQVQVACGEQARGHVTRGPEQL